MDISIGYKHTTILDRPKISMHNESDRHIEFHLSIDEHLLELSLFPANDTNIDLFEKSLEWPKKTEYWR